MNQSDILWLIPAHAGKTSCCHAAAGAFQAHPRSRGENDGLMPACRRPVGSSPLTRGKRHTRPDRIPPHRLIPAHAGKTRHEALEVLNPRAHPRSRGEN